MVAEFLLSWLGASVATSSCQEQASLPLQLSAWCVCMVVILILGGICTQSATFAIFKSWKCQVFLLNTIYAKRAKMDRMLTIAPVVIPYAWMDRMLLIAPVVIPRPSYMLLLYSNRSTQSSTLVLWLMRSLRPFRHIIISRIQTSCCSSIVVCHRLARKLVTSTYQLLPQEEEEGLRQRVCQDVLSPLQPAHPRGGAPSALC